MPDISEEWIEYERSHGGRFCLAGSIEDIVEQVNDLTARIARITGKEPLFNSELEVFDTKAMTVPIRVYRPLQTNPSDNLPLCFFSHGGGFVTGNLDSEDGFCRWIAKSTPCVVVSVDYRLGPEFKIPTILKDVITAFEWVRTPKNRLVTEKTRIFTLGGSAGGALSLALANYLTDVCGEGKTPRTDIPQLGGIVALNPVTLHPDGVPAEHQQVYTSYTENSTDVPIMGAEAMRTYLSAVNCMPDDTRILAALTTRPECFPPSYIVTCGVDPLRDDGLIMEAKLRQAGVPTKLDHYPGLPHIFWIFPDFAMTEVFSEKLLAGIRFVLEKGLQKEMIN